MAVVTSPLEFNAERLFVDLTSTFGHQLFLKCEGFNFAGSVKLKAALAMVEAAERAGRLRPGSVLVESSSGNLGVALSMIAANRGYEFVCVTDMRCNLATRRMMEALGARIHKVLEPDAHGGYLGARIDYVRALCASDPRYVWLNQYANPNNWKAHFTTTAPAIASEFPELDVLFVGAGSTQLLVDAGVLDGTDGVGRDGGPPGGSDGRFVGAEGPAGLAVGAIERPELDGVALGVPINELEMPGTRLVGLAWRAGCGGHDQAACVGMVNAVSSSTSGPYRSSAQPSW